MSKIYGVPTFGYELQRRDEDRDQFSPMRSLLSISFSYTAQRDIQSTSYPLNASCQESSASPALEVCSFTISSLNFSEFSLVIKPRTSSFVRWTVPMQGVSSTMCWSFTRTNRHKGFK